MPSGSRPEIDATSFRFAVVVSRFNNRITDRLLEGARQYFRDRGVPENHVEVFRCPGAFELPQLALKIIASRRVDAVVCLGAVIRGDTPHFEYVAGEAARGIQDVALRTGVPVTFGVLTTDTELQAVERAGGREGNKGWEAAASALEMANLFRTAAKRRTKSSTSRRRRGQGRT
ncbi:MAG: 6,7-dimethyl-8-ribityllumazine synthase [Bacteroidota bacterium]